MAITSHNINPNQVSLEDAKAFAMEYLRPYVERGDTLEQICEGGMGMAGPTYAAQIGSVRWMWGKSFAFYENRFIVTELGGKECILQFGIEELIAEIKQPVKQMSLF